MANLLVWVNSVSLTEVESYNDSVYLAGYCQVEGSGSIYGWSATSLLSGTANDLADACIASAVAVMAGHSITVGSEDAKMLVGAPDREPPDITGLATTSAMTAGDAGRMAVPGASSTVSLSSGTARQPSSTRPVLVMVSGSWSWNLTAIGTQTGSLTIKSDSASTPTTVIRAPTWSRGIGVGVAVNDTGTMPVEIDVIVPTGHYYSVTAAGGATFTVREQVL